MKKIFVYLLTYSLVTTTVATGVIRFSKNHTPSTSPSTSISTSSPEEIDTPVSKFLGKAMTSEGIYLDADIEIKQEDSSIAYIRLNGNVNFSSLPDITLLADLTIDSSYIKTNAEIAYFSPYAYVSNDVFHGKLETEKAITGIQELMEIVAPDFSLGDNSFDEISTDDIVRNLQNMEFVNQEDGTLKGTLTIPNLVDVDLYLDQDCNLVRAAVESFTISSFTISLDAKTNFLTKCKLISPEENKVFEDYTDLITVAKNAYSLTKENQFSLSFNAQVKKDDEVTSLRAQAMIDKEKKDFYVDGHVLYQEENMDFLVQYSPEKMLFSINELLKGKLSKENMARIKSIIEEYLPNEEGVSFLEKKLQELLAREEIQNIKNAELHELLSTFKNIDYINNELQIQIDAENYIAGNGNILINLGVEDLQIHRLQIQNLSYQGYSLDAELILSAYEGIPTLQESEFQDYTPLLTIYDEVKRLSEETEFAFNVDMTFINGEKSYHVYGFVQFALKEKTNEETGAVESDNSAYVDLHIDDGVKDHSLIMDLRNAMMYFSYNHNMFGKMQIQTLKEMVKQIQDLFESKDPLLSEITALLPSEDELSVIMKIIKKDYSALSLDILKEFQVEDDHLHLVVSQDFLGSKSDIDMTVGYQNQTLSSLEIQDLTMGAITMSLKANFTDYQQDVGLEENENYLDLDSLSLLLKIGINTMHQEYYHMKGKVDISFKIGSGELMSMPVGLEIYLHNRLGKVEMMIHLEDIPVKEFNLLVVSYGNKLPGGLKANEHSGYSGGYSSTSSTNREAFIYVNEDKVYLERKEQASFSKIFASSVQEEYKKSLKTTPEDFLNNIYTYLFDIILGFNESTMDLINSEMNMLPVEEMQFDQLIKEMKYEEEYKKFTYGLNLSALTGNDAIKNTIVTINHTETDGIERLDFLDLSMRIGLSIFNIDIQLHLGLVDYGDPFDENAIIYQYCMNYPYEESTIYVSHKS